MLSVDEVKHIAELARIGLSDDEVGPYQRDLSSALDWFTALKDVSTDEVSPIAHVTGEHNRAALDVAKTVAPDERAGILENMPMREENATKVKSVF